MIHQHEDNNKPPPHPKHHTTLDTEMQQPISARRHCYTVFPGWLAGCAWPALTHSHTHTYTHIHAGKGTLQPILLTLSTACVTQQLPPPAPPGHQSYWPTPAINHTQQALAGICLLYSSVTAGVTMAVCVCVRAAHKEVGGGKPCTAGRQRSH